jgi:uroporphyrinogen III methyltransferase/synthase
LVDVIPVYRTTLPETDTGRIKEMLKNSEIDLLTFTSPLIVKNFCELIGEKKLWENIKVACIGPITERKARELGFKVEIVAKEYTVDSLVEEIIRPSLRR